MKSLVKGILAVLVITLVLDLAFGTSLRYLYRHSTSVDAKKLCDVTYSIDAPVLFMGSSRCHHTYIPRIISDSIHKEVFNAGLWGMRNIYFQYGLLCNILERYTPETICYEVHPGDYMVTPYSGIEKSASLCPFVHLSDGCDEILRLGGYYYLCLMSRTYRYNSEFPRLVLRNIVNENEDEDGFLKLTNTLDTNKVPVVYESMPSEIDTLKLRYLHKFVEKCKEKGIQLILIQSSQFYPDTSNTQQFDIPNEISKRYDLPFINDYYSEDFYLRPELFSDLGHFNEQGAILFSQKIAGQLKHFIK